MVQKMWGMCASFLKNKQNEEFMDPIGAEVRSAIFVTGIAFCLVFETFFPLGNPPCPGEGMFS
jgi:hypothetical protein